MISSGSRDGTKAIRKVSIFLLLVSEDAVVLVLLSVEFALLSVELALLVVEFVLLVLLLWDSLFWPPQPASRPTHNTPASRRESAFFIL
jgi:type IV secretory pathway TrbL component